MDTTRRTRPHPAVFVAAIALTFALVGTAIAGPDAMMSKVTQSKVKKIARKQANKRITKRESGLSVLRAETANPTGPAGGDLTGDYPDPLIGEQKVTTDKIADDAVNSAKIADNAVAASELGPTQLATANTGIAANGNAATSVQCPAGTQVLSGGGTSSSFGVLMVTSFQSGNGWVVAYHSTVATAQTITAIATCLSQPAP